MRGGAERDRSGHGWLRQPSDEGDGDTGKRGSGRDGEEGSDAAVLKAELPGFADGHGVQEKGMAALCSHQEKITMLVGLQPPAPC